jgi:hypothetical protein
MPGECWHRIERCSGGDAANGNYGKIDKVVYNGKRWGDENSQMIPERLNVKRNRVGRGKV